MSRRKAASVLWSVAIFIVFATGLLMRLTVVAGDEAQLLTAVPDDAFYYLQVARNVVTGQGVTFDGLHVTNGFHPLWLTLILPSAAFITNPLLLLRVVLSLGIFFNLLATVVTIAWLRRALSPLAALLGAIAFYLNPAAAANSINGLETALAGLLLVLAVRQTWLARGHFWLGVVLGALVLARSDLFLVSVALGTVAVWQSAPEERRPVFRRLIVTALLIIVPWYVWSWAAVGSPWPGSATAVPRVTHGNFLSDNSTVALVRYSGRLFLRFLRSGGTDLLGFPRFFWLLVTPAAAVSLWRSEAKRIRRWRPLLIALGAALTTLIVVHVAGRWLARAWYFDSVIWSGAFLLAWLVWRLQAWRPRLTPVAALLLVLALLFSWQDRGRWLFAYPHQVEFRETAVWLNAALEPGEYASAFNAGIMGYYSGGRVVNLDGVINDAAYQAIGDRTLLAYLQQLPVAYLADYPATIATYRPYFGSVSGMAVDEVARIDVPDVAWEEAPDQPIIVFQLRRTSGPVVGQESR